jgi:hypothetical protein
MKRDFTVLNCFVDDFIKHFEQNIEAINSSNLNQGRLVISLEVKF